MALWGKFESVKELAQSGVGLLWSARPSGDAAQGSTEKYIIKTTEQLALLGDIERLEHESALFLEAAAVQKALADGGAQHWVKIVELGNTDQGAFYVAERYGRSVSTLVTRGIRLDGHGIRHLVLGILDGLEEIQTKAGRAHGNIKPTNVLIGGPDSPSVTGDPVVLTDPTPTRSLGKQAAAEDMRHLGELVYELVTLRAPKSGVGMTVSINEDWSRLGSSANTWIDFCNRLLDVSPGKPAPDIDQVREMVPAGVSAPSAKSKVPLIAAAAFLLLAGGGVTAWKLMKPSGPPPIVITDEQIQQADKAWPIVEHAQVWLGNRTTLADPLRSLDAELAAGLPEVLKSDAKFVVDDVESRNGTKLPSNWLGGKPLAEASENAKEKIQKFTNALTELNKFRSEMDAFAPKAQVEARAVEWESRGWKSQAECLRAANAELDRLRGTGSKIDSKIEVAKAGDCLGLVAYSVGIEAKYRQLAEAAAGAESSADQAAKSFIEIASNAIGKLKGDERLDVRQPDVAKIAFKGMADAIKSFTAIASEVKDATNADKVDLEYVRQTPAYAAVTDKSKAPTIDDVKAWIAEAKKPEYAIRERDELAKWAAAPLATIAEKREHLALRVEAKVTTPDAAKLLTQELDAAKEKVEALKGVAKLSDKRLASLDAQRASAANAVDAIAGKILPPGKYRTAKALADAAVAAAVPAQFEQAWKGTVAQIMQGQTDDLAKLYRLEQLLLNDKSGWLVALNAAPARFPIPAAPEAAVANAEAFNAAVKAKRDAALASYATKIKPAADGQSVDLSDADAVLGGYTAFLAALDSTKLHLAAALDGYSKGLGESDPEVATLLAKVRKPAEGVDGVAIFAPGLKPFNVLAAMKASVSSGSLGLDDLLKRVAESPDLALKLAAWEGVALVKDWSGKTGQLASLSQSARSLADAVAKSKASDAEKKRMSDGIATAQKQAWIGVMNWASSAKGSDEAIDQTLAAASGLGVKTEADVSGLSAPAMFNWSLARGRESLAGAKAASGSEDALAAEARKVNDKLESLAKQGGLPDAKADPIRRMMKRFADASTVVPPKMFDKDSSGPLTGGENMVERNGWTADEREDGRVLVYSFAGPSGKHDLRFEIIDEPNGIMMMTSEVSVGLFADALASAKKLPQVSGTLRDKTNAEQAGASAWDLSPEGFRAANAARPAEAWLSFVNDAKSAFKDTIADSGAKAWPAVVGPAPSLQMPMTWVTPQAAAYFAASLGCRLPTPEEWKAALPRRGARENRRDADWKTFADNANKLYSDLGGQNGGVNITFLMPHTSALGLADPENPQTDLASASTGSDGFVFFAPVEPPAEPGFADLIGNVWEFTHDNPAAWPCVAGKSVPEFGQFARLSEFDSSHFKAIGGSAFSGPKLSPDTAIPLSAAGASSDLGIRLVFVRGEGSSKKSVADRIDRALKIGQNEPKYWRP